MGIIFAAGWTPCIGPIYGAILTMAANANNGSMGQAAGLLLAYSLGLGLPFLLTAAALDQMRGLLKRLQRRMRMIEVFSGVFLIIIGYLVFTDQLAALAQTSNSFADFSTNLENCVYLMSQGEIPLSEFSACMSLGAKYQPDKPIKPSSQSQFMPSLPDAEFNPSAAFPNIIAWHFPYSE